MKAEKKQICSYCGKEEATTKCDHCGVALCQECCNLEIWGTGAESLGFRYFCLTCKNDPSVDSWDADGNMPDSPAEEKIARRVKKIKKVQKADQRSPLPRMVGSPYPTKESDTVRL